VDQHHRRAGQRDQRPREHPRLGHRQRHQRDARPLRRRHVPAGADLNSRQSWFYEGGSNNYNSSDQNPADGNPRQYFDESRTFVSGAPIAPGSTLS